MGIRPTLGLVSRAGVIPYSFTQDAAGPLARPVADAAKVLNVLVGYDPDDPATHKVVRDMFAEQVGWAAEAGVDFVIAETIDYLGEALLALEAIKAHEGQ